MTPAEYEAKILAENTKIEWRPINDAAFKDLYLLSAKGDVYSIKKHSVLSKRKFKKCPTEYIELSSNLGRNLYQINELMLKTFPEQSSDAPDVEWKTIEIDGEKTVYEVNRVGEVRRINNHRILKPQSHRDGYLYVRMRHQGKTIFQYLHRIVATAFVPNPNGYEIVNHIDENRQNDTANNLEWCDKSYNFKYSYNRRKEKLWLKKVSDI